jgi:hypothetical protein
MVVYGRIALDVESRLATLLILNTWSVTATAH